MKKIYMVALLVLLAVGVAVPLWYSTRDNPEQASTAAGELSGGVSNSPGEAKSEPRTDGKRREQALTGRAADEPGLEKSEPSAGERSSLEANPSSGSESKKPAPKNEQKPSGVEGVSKDPQPKKEQHAIPVDLAIVGKKGKIMFKRCGVETYGSGNVIDTLDAAGVAYETSHNAEFVVSVGGQKNSGMSGWMYQLNGETVMKSAARQKIQPGDCVLWWYSEGLDQAPPQWSEL